MATLRSTAGTAASSSQSEQLLEGAGLGDLVERRLSVDDAGRTLGGVAAGLLAR
jgi:hypothetical protein